MFDSIKTPEKIDINDIELPTGCAVYTIERSYKDESTDIVINTDAVAYGACFVIVPHGVEVTRII